MKKYAKFLSAVVFLVALSSCYKMPGPDDYCLVPSTNNPHFTKETAGPTPGIPY